jgi:hypothetical protein
MPGMCSSTIIKIHKANKLNRLNKPGGLKMQMRPAGCDAIENYWGQARLSPYLSEK